MTTMGEVHTFLLLDPRFAELAARPFPWPPADHQPESPGLLTMAANLAGAVLDHVADGMAQASPEVQEMREQTCASCPFLVNLACTKCGCGMPTKWSWASSACPLDPPKWEAV